MKHIFQPFFKLIKYVLGYLCRILGYLCRRHRSPKTFKVLKIIFTESFKMKQNGKG